MAGGDFDALHYFRGCHQGFAEPVCDTRFAGCLGLGQRGPIYLGGLEHSLLGLDVYHALTAPFHPARNGQAGRVDGPLAKEVFA